MRFKTLTLLTLYILSIYAEEPETPLPPDFCYLSIGGTCLYIAPAGGPDLFLGRRHFFKQKQAVDFGMGSAAIFFGRYDPPRLFYGQVSYLYYPACAPGLYFGPGITFGVMRGHFICGREGVLPLANLPITLGYQFQQTKHFLQLQATPLGTLTVSYGCGF